MKTPQFDYHAPESLQDCLQLLAEHGDDAVILAGGQSLVPLMRLRLAEPGHVVSLRALGPELRAIRIEDGRLRIGAGATYAEIQRSEAVRSACPGLPQAIALIATPAVRNRGTLGGNLCHADPASELPALALALEARLHLRSTAGERVVPADEFFLGPYMTDRQGDEILTEIVFPVRPADERTAVLEVTRLRGGFPMAGVAVALAAGSGGSVRSAAVACFAVNSVQVRVRAAESALLELGCTAAGIERAAAAIDEAVKPHADPFASVEYKRSAVRTLFRQAVQELSAATGGRS